MHSDDPCNRVQVRRIRLERRIAELIHDHHGGDELWNTVTLVERLPGSEPEYGKLVMASMAAGGHHMHGGMNMSEPHEGEVDRCLGATDICSKLQFRLLCYRSPDPSFHQDSGVLVSSGSAGLVGAQRVE